MKNVLIVEDDEIIAGEVAKHLSLWQMKCTVVEDFQRVIETFVGFVLFLIGVGVTAIISSAILANTGKTLSESKRKKTLVIVLLIAAALALVPSGFLIYKFVAAFLL